VPRLSVRFAELSVPMTIGPSCGWPKTRRISAAYAPSCEARSVATLSYLPTLPSSSMISTTVEIFLTAWATAKVVPISVGRWMAGALFAVGVRRRLDAILMPSESTRRAALAGTVT